MHKLIHLTDPHLVSPGRKLYALDPLGRLKPAIDAIKARHADAAAVFITGDLTHWGEGAAYAALQEEMARLPMPCHLVLGNHDTRGSFFDTFPDAPTDDEGFVQYVMDLPGTKALVLDTLVDGAAYGALCAARLGWIERTLSALRGQELFVFLHHAPFPIGIPGLDNVRLNQGAERLGELLLRHGRVRHLFYGHVHRPVSGAWRGIPCSSVPAIAHQFLLRLGGNDVLHGTHEPPALGVVLWDEISLVLHLDSYLDDSPSFSLADPKAEPAQSLAELLGR